MMNNTAPILETDIADGWYNISNDSYHNGPGLSKSGMARILKTPRHFIQPGEPEDKDIFTFGDALHAAVFEPERYKKEYVIIPADCQIGSGEGQRGRLKAFMLKCEEERLTVLKPNWPRTIEAMRQEVVNHPMVKEFNLLTGGQAELSGYYHDPDFDNVLTKIRCDYLKMDRPVIVDLKGMADVRTHNFTNKAYDLKYHIQAGHYSYTAMKLTGLVHDFFFIAVEKPPINQEYRGQYLPVKVYKATEKYINEGLIERSRALTTYNECMKSGIWPGIDEAIEELDLPGWVMRKPDMMPIFE